jgi:hypothetical protein
MAISTLLCNECSFAALLEALTEQACDNENWRPTCYVLLGLLYFISFSALALIITDSLYTPTYAHNRIISYPETWTLPHVSAINYHHQGGVNTKVYIISIHLIYIRIYLCFNPYISVPDDGP